MVVENMYHATEIAIGYAMLFLPFVNISLNPFIYVTKHEGVRRILARMMSCRKQDDAPAVSGTSGSNRNTDGIGRKQTKPSIATK